MQKQNSRQTFNYLLYAILFAIGSLALYFNQPKGENKVVEEKKLIYTPPKIVDDSEINKGDYEEVRINAPLEIPDEYSRPVQFPGGQEAWRNYLQKALQHPQQALINGIQGTVEVQFVVDNDGTISEVKAISGLQELTAEAERVTKNSRRWEPAQERGTPARYYLRPPVTFKLEYRQDNCCVQEDNKKNR